MNTCLKAGFTNAEISDRPINFVTKIATTEFKKSLS